MSLCKQCVSGVRHEGTPTGKFEEINGVKTYVALPEGEYPKDKAVLFLADAFGIELINNQLLIDDFARNGFQVYAPDYFKGDPVPLSFMDEKITQFDFRTWIQNHSREQTRPIVDALISGLKGRGVTQFSATGYCFGARYVFDLAFDGEIKAAAVSHPSLLEVPADLEKFAKTNVPLLINSCEVDGQYPPEKQKIGDEILGGGKHAPGYERTYWEGCTHGFAVRGDISDPKIKAGREGSFKATVEWFIKYL